MHTTYITIIMYIEHVAASRLTGVFMIISLCLNVSIGVCILWSKFLAHSIDPAIFGWPLGNGGDSYNQRSKEGIHYCTITHALKDTST